MSKSKTTDPEARNALARKLILEALGEEVTRLERDNYRLRAALTEIMRNKADARAWVIANDALKEVHHVD